MKKSEKARPSVKMNHQLSLGELRKEADRLSKIIATQRRVMETLFAISSAVTTVHDSDALLKKVMELIVGVIDAKSVVYWSLKPRLGVKCWETMECDERTCPAYESEDHSCWSIPSTQCRPGVAEMANFEKKLPFCLECPMLLDSVLTAEQFIGIDAELSNKKISVSAPQCKDLFSQRPSISVCHTMSEGRLQRVYRQVTWLPSGHAGSPKLVESEGCSVVPPSGQSTRICLGLITQNQILGMICLLLEDIHYVSEDEAYLLTNIAQIAATTIENTVFYTLMTKQNKRMASMCMEAHHRIKNNLQTLSGLSFLQLQQSTDPKIKNLLMDNLMRIKSIAFVHQMLSEDSYAKVRLPELADHIIESGIQLANIEKKLLTYSVSGDAISADSKKATSLAIIVNELVTNSIKHGFRRGQAGSINALFKKTQHGYNSLDFSDDGKGFPHDFDIDRDANLGLRMVSDVVREDLNGSIELSGGAHIHILFKI